MDYVWRKTSLKSDSVKKNLLFQFMYQFIILVIPIVLSPYLTRTLGEGPLGIYSYTNSIAYYFVVFCMLGISRHGQRVIASRKENDIALRKTFWSLFSVHSIVSLIGLIGYLLFCFLFSKNNSCVFYAQSLYVLSALFDITWFFYGIEKFKNVVIRNALIKVIELILIFLLVKGNDDLMVYTIIMTSSMLLCQLMLFPTAIKIVKPISFSKEDMIEHIKPMLLLSVSVIAVSLYTVFDKTLLGIMTNTDNVAFYEYSNKIINIPKTFISVVGTVLFPRACTCFANNDIVGAKKYYNYSLMVVYLIGFGSVFGLLAISDLFVSIYYGENFIVCSNIIKTLSPVILIISLGDIFRVQFLIPMKKDVQFTICILINAVINLILSVVLIPILGIYGAVIGTICAEVFGLIYQGIAVKEYVDIKNTITSALPFLLASLIMYAVISLIQILFDGCFIALVVQMVVGILVYMLILSIYFLCVSKNREVFRQYLINNILRLFRR